MLIGARCVRTEGSQLDRLSCPHGLTRKNNDPSSQPAAVDRQQGGEVERLSLSYFLSYLPPREMNPNTPEPLAKIVYKCLVVPEYGLAQLEADLVDFLRKE